jgi:hypothetical protein
MSPFRDPGRRSGQAIFPLVSARLRLGCTRFGSPGIFG